MADREKTLNDITEIEKDFNEIEQQYFNLADREQSSNTSDDSEQDETDVEDCGDDFNLLNIAEDEEPAAQPQNLVHDQPAGAGPEQAVPNVVSLKNKAKCTCTAPCINSFESEPIELGRTVLLGLTKECHDLVVLGKLSAFLHRDSHTRRSKKAEQGERKRLRSDYTHEGRFKSNLITKAITLNKTQLPVHYLGKDISRCHVVITGTNVLGWKIIPLISFTEVVSSLPIRALDEHFPQYLASLAINFGLCYPVPSCNFTAIMAAFQFMLA